MGFRCRRHRSVDSIFGMIILICFATFWLGRYRSDQVLVSGQETLLTARPILAFSILIIELAILYTSQSLSVAILLIPVIFLMIHDRNQAVLWPSVGVVTPSFLQMVMASRFNTRLELECFLLLLPWLLASEEESNVKSPSLSSLSLHVPLVGGGSFLVLTWLLLLAEIDGASPQAHEAFRSILIGMLAAGLLIYSLEKAPEYQRRTILILGIIVSLLATLYGLNYFPLPGNADQLLTQSIDRGHISRFLLVWLIIALPPSIIDLTSTIKKTLIVRKMKKPNLRILGSHLAHAGILILLVGHVLTTTLVDRVDPSHQITLIRNEQIRHGDFLYEMTDITTLVRDEDPEFE